jgi:hypothetical protein
MLAAPDSSLGPAGNPTHRRVELLADWIELAAAKENGELYRREIEALLVEQYFVKDQDDAARNVSDAWRVLRRRKRVVGEGYPFELTNKYIFPQDRDNKITYIFLLVLSAPEYLSGFSLGKGGAFRNFFELVTVESVVQALPGWDVYWCGATSKDMKTAGGIVKYVAKILSTNIRDVTYFSSAQDGGVDFMAVLKAGDQRSARPALWGQCASGLDWEKKVQEPNFAHWADAVRVLPRPLRVFAVPFAFGRRTFTKTAIKSEGWVMDRERISANLFCPTTEKLAEMLRSWVTRQMNALPQAT